MLLTGECYRWMDGKLFEKKNSPARFRAHDLREAASAARNRMSYPH
jgi:hypothetical protein